ncbi:MAG: GNAT family N-acetyltransferase [Spirochaetaceae bacterium]|nr:GNAT family N-acetyltransferase [Spirochaetaceae bacterium]
MKTISGKKRKTLNIIPEMLTRTNMYNDVIIERAKASDAKELLDFWKIVGAETDNLSFGSEGKPVTESEEFEKLKRLEESTVEAYFVARKDSAIIGTAHYTANERKRMNHRGTIGICILQSASGKGLGTRFMQTLLDFAKTTAKSEIVELEVRSDNVNAIKLYEKFGFEKIGVFKGFFKIDGKLIDFDLMEKIL